MSATVEVLQQNPGRLWVRIGDNSWEFTAVQVEVVDAPGLDHRAVAAARLAEMTAPPPTPMVYWTLPEPERYVQTYTSTGAALERHLTGERPVPGQDVVWVYWCEPKLRRYRLDAPGLRTRPRRVA